MTTLHLGVIDISYGTPPSAGKRRRGSNSTIANTKTTGDVADLLEQKYHVMELFVEEIGIDHISKSLEQSLEDAMNDIAAGAPPQGIRLTQQAEQEMETAFRIFIDQQELDGVVPGVPTAAALKGVSHRLSHPYAKGNPSRPSFRDTGQYQASFRAWID
jgi:hypothetical protein